MRLCIFMACKYCTPEYECIQRCCGTNYGCDDYGNLSFITDLMDILIRYQDKNKVS